MSSNFSKTLQKQRKLNHSQFEKWEIQDNNVEKSLLKQSRL